ncbi:MAG: phage portal protein, partial [Halodesulfovibrio sp.]
KAGFFHADPDYLDVTCDDEVELDFPESAEPGSFDVLPVGYSFKEYNPQYPQGEFKTFTSACLTSAAAGLDVSYSALTGDLSGANYSSLRAGALDERETWKDLQQWFIDKFVRLVYEDWVSVAVLAQAITIGHTPLRIDRVDQYKRARFQPRRWAWVDPAKDANAHRTEQDGLMRSVSESIRESGRDPDEVFDEIAEERRKWDDLGIAQVVTKAAPTIEEEPDNADKAAGTDETDKG